MFYHAFNFNQDVSHWNISVVTDLNSSFANTTALSNANRGLIHQSFASNPNWPYNWSEYVAGNGNNPATDGNSTSETGNENNSTGPGNPDSNVTTIVVDNNTTSPSDDNVTNPGISPTPEYFRPLVRTGEASTITANSATLSGMILDDGDANISEAGFLISILPMPKPGDPNTQKLITDANSSDIEILIDQLVPNEKYFYRAYAVNTEGLSLGSVESFSTPGGTNGLPWINAQPAEENNWWISPWFGNFYAPDNRGWLMHADLGWLVACGKPEESLWLWKKDIGWLWTKPGIYPFLYSSSTSGWLFYHGDSPQGMLFFDYAQNQWLILSE